MKANHILMLAPTHHHLHCPRGCIVSLLNSEELPSQQTRSVNSIINNSPDLLAQVNTNMLGGRTLLLKKLEWLITTIESEAIISQRELALSHPGVGFSGSIASFLGLAVTGVQRLTQPSSLHPFLQRAFTPRCPGNREETSHSP